MDDRYLTINRVAMDEAVAQFRKQLMADALDRVLATPDPSKKHALKLKAVAQVCDQLDGFVDNLFMAGADNPRTHERMAKFHEAMAGVSR